MIEDTDFTFAMLDSVGRVYQVDDSVAVCAAEHFLRPTRFASGDDQGDLCAGGSLWLGVSYRLMGCDHMNPLMLPSACLTRCAEFNDAVLGILLYRYSSFREGNV